MTNRDIAKVFRSIAELLQLSGDNSFRVRSYQRAADTIDGLTADLAELYARGELEALPGIGEALSQKIRELLDTGELEYHQELKASLPPELPLLLEIQDLGPKTVRKFYQELGIETIDALEAAANEQKLRALKGFGAKSEERLLVNLARWRKGHERALSAVALALAEPLLEQLGALESVQQVSLAGSLRRGRETTKDIDLLVAAADGTEVLERFVSGDEVEAVTGRGETKASVQLKGGLNADLRVVDPASWGAALQYFTGSKAHNIALRSRALDRGLSLNEYGISRLDDEADRTLSASEAEFYAALDLPWIPPELREDRGEIAAAEAGELPELLSQSDIRGDLHCHSTWSDGSSTILEMALAAKARGYAFHAVCDHSQALTVANGLSPQRVRAQADEIADVQAQVPEVRLLRGIEVDILADGALDLPLDLLAELDVVVASVHSRFNQDIGEMTARLLRAIESGVVDILGHPTGRLLRRREGYEFALDEVFDAAVEHGVALEINAAPERLDLDDIMARRARRRGALLSLNTDAHQTDQLANLRYGVLQARRAWLTAADIINTKTPEELLAWLKD